jgi:hypothetical protein
VLLAACAIHVTPVDPHPSPRELEIAIPELVGAYVKDPIAADARLGHNPIRVEGVYHIRIKSFFGEVSAAPSGGGSVRCAKDDAARSIREGSAVSLRGFVDRFYNGEVYIRQCEWTVR